MILSYEWLKEYVKTKLSLQQLAEKMTMIGLEVDSVETGKDFEKVVIGQVIELKTHPNADRLHLTRVDVGNEKLDIVCGANNLSVGIKVPVVLVGGKVQGFEIKKANLRGVESNGMICSEKELGLGEDHTGIMILPEEAPVGKNLEDYLDFDAVLDISLQPNRPDCTGVVGLAREVAAATDEELHLPKIKVVEDGREKIEETVEIEVKDAALCPRYMARAVKGLKIGPSPTWMQKRLSASGVRPINNLVDISNYVMLEYGQPLHFFDLSKLAKEKDKTKVIIRRAEKTEKITTLDGMERELNPNMLVIADSSGPIAVAGIMGGASSEVDDNTVDVLIEAAVFDKTIVRRASKSLGLRSEAVSRFEKGLPMRLPEVAVDRAAQLLTEICGGKTVSGRIDKLAHWIWIQHIGLSVSDVKEILGYKISENQIVDILNRLGFEAEKFDIVAEAKKHLGKPYAFGANFKENGTTAFDCSYLTDYIYRLIDVRIGHTSLGQLHHGWEVGVKELKPGDILFYKGHIEKSAVGEYYVSDDKGNKIKMKTDKYPSGVGHNGMYIGGGQVIHASCYDYDEKAKDWVKKKDEKEHNVHIVPVENFTKNPEYIGARRYVENLDDLIAVTVPWWRPDVKEECDLYEEIARIAGYDRIPATLPSQGNIVPVENPGYRFCQEIKKYLGSIGLTEVSTYSFVSKKELEKVGYRKEAVNVVNPIVKDKNLLRPTLIPQMLTSLAENQFNAETLSFFEISRTFEPTKPGALPKESKMLAGGFIGGDTFPYNYEDGKEYYFAKGVLDALFARLGIKAVFKETAEVISEKGRGADIEIRGKKIGIICEVRKEIADYFNLKKKAVVFELDLSEIEKHAARAKNFVEISKFPAVVRDLSAVLPKTAEIGVLREKLEEIGKPLEEVTVNDIYEGKPLSNDEKSVTFRFKLASFDKTLTEEEVEKVITACKNKIEKNGGKIRSGSGN
jgi:phenylalanyl-tRNA synthetase beta subunit